MSLASTSALPNGRMIVTCTCGVWMDVAKFGWSSTTCTACRSEIKHPIQDVKKDAVTDVARKTITLTRDDLEWLQRLSQLHNCSLSVALRAAIENTRFEARAAGLILPPLEETKTKTKTNKGKSK